MSAGMLAAMHRELQNLRVVGFAWLYRQIGGKGHAVSRHNPICEQYLSTALDYTPTIAGHAGNVPDMPGAGLKVMVERFLPLIFIHWYWRHKTPVSTKLVNRM